MIELKGISKVYNTGEHEQKALDNITIAFRDAEFVSVLGASGSGKTTLLNIIGGLDHATSGTLYINGVSTAQYKSTDWDTYRNHHVGFIFQSYNLIPHQSVLSNVEIALTLSGVPADERKKRALAVLDKVGLSEHVEKKPSQLSGGQAQRVAIARALVNDPDIILADEPTGALDTATGIQIMEILKEVSKDRLVIMVTHNPELAEEYATRIVTISDGQLVHDSDPCPLSIPQKTNVSAMSDSKNDGPTITVDGKQVKKDDMLEQMFAEEEIMFDDPAENFNAIDPTYISNVLDYEQHIAESQNTDKDENDPKDKSQKKRASMSFKTALSLSFNNLMTKKGRTFLTAFAGSIGITGIAIILALSNGVNHHVEKVQRDALAGMPLVISKENIEFITPDNMEEMQPIEESEVQASDSNTIGQNNTIANMYTEDKNGTSTNVPVKKNNLQPFKEYLDSHRDIIDPLVTSITYEYDTKPVFMRNVDGKYTVVGNNLPDTSNPLKRLESANLLKASKNFAANGFDELLDNSEIIKSFFTLEKGSWPTNSHEAILVLDNQGKIDDFVLYGIGVLNNKQVDEFVEDAVNKNKDKSEKKTFPQVDFTYDDAINLKYTAIPSAYTYVKDGKGYKQDLSENHLQEIASKGFDIEVVGVIKPKGTEGFHLAPGIYYHETLPTDLIKEAGETEIVKAQLANPEIDVFSGKTFKQIEKEKENPFNPVSTPDIADYIPSLPEIPELPDPTEEIENVLNPSSLEVSKEQIDMGVDAIVDSIDTTQLTNIILNAPSPDIKTLDLSDMSEQDKSEVIKEALNLAQKFVPWYLTEQPKLPQGTPVATIVTKYLDEPASIASLNKIQSLIGPETKNKVKTWVNSYLNNTLVPYFQRSLNPVIDQVSKAASEQINIVVGQKTAQVSQALSEALSKQMSSLQSLAGGYALGSMPIPQIPDFDSTQLPGGLEGLQDLLQDSSVSYEDNLAKLGYANLNKPSSISMYPKSFDDKEKIEHVIEDYNKIVTEEGHPDDVISYTDLMKYFVSQVVKIIDTISMILIAFVSVSLVVSSIMIGIITYISVLERRKEIGILRAMGASRRNIANVFNAETAIEGFISGMIAIIFVYLISIPVNIVVFDKFEIENIMSLPISYALLLLGVAIALNLVAGLIPSSKAARRDPVEALRSE